MLAHILYFARHNPCAFFFLSVCAAFFLLALGTDLMQERRP